MAFPKDTDIPIIADVTESAYFLWLRVYNDGTHFSLYYPKVGEDEEYVPVLDRELSAADDALTYAEFIANEDCTTIQVESISGDISSIASSISELSELEVDEITDMGSMEEHQNDKAVYFTPATT